MKEVILIQILIALGGILLGGFVTNTIWLRVFRKYTKLNIEIRASMHTDLQAEVAAQKAEIARLEEEVKTWRTRANVALRAIKGG